MVIAILLQRTSSLFSTCQYFKSHRILTHWLIPFHLHPAPDQLSKEFYLIVFSLPLFFFFFLFLFPLSQPGLYTLLLLVCFPHPLKITFFYCRHLIFTYAFLQYSYFRSTFIKLHSAVVAIDPAVGFLQFCSRWFGTFSILLQTSYYTLPSSYPIVPISHSCCTYVVNIALSLSSPWFYLKSYQFSSLLPHNIFLSFSHIVFPLSYYIISTILLHIY